MQTHLHVVNKQESLFFFLPHYFLQALPFLYFFFFMALFHIIKLICGISPHYNNRGEKKRKGLFKCQSIHFLKLSLPKPPILFKIKIPSSKFLGCERKVHYLAETRKGFRDIMETLCRSFLYAMGVMVSPFFTGLCRKGEHNEQ